MNQLATRTPILIAAEINSIKDQTRKMLLVNSIEIGRRLVEAKEMVPHGEWGKWLEESVDYSKSTANNLMNIFEQFGADQFSLFGSEAKSQTFGDLSYSQAVALLGVPAEEREQFIVENNAQEMSARELKQAIKEKQELERQLKESEKRAKESEALAKKAEKEREKLEKEFKKLETTSKNWNQIIEKLESELDAAKASGNDEEITRLQDNLNIANDELADSKERIKKLEQQLKEKPIEAPAVVEKIPEEVEKELSDLRKIAAAQGSSKSIAKFEVCFNSLAAGFKDLLGTLEQIEDDEVTKKYKTAVKGLIDKMVKRL